jgi:hypothetical protein
MSRVRENARFIMTPWTNVKIFQAEKKRVLSGSAIIYETYMTYCAVHISSRLLGSFFRLAHTENWTKRP